MKINDLKDNYLKQSVYMEMERAIRHANPNSVSFYVNEETKDAIFKEDELIKMDNEITNIDKYIIKRFSKHGCDLCVSNIVKEKTIMMIPVSNQIKIREML